MNTQHIIDALVAVQAAILANESQIESLDRAIGDGDHFINVRRGCEVLVAMRDELAPLPPAAAFAKIGTKLLSTIGGASGPLISSFFTAMGKALGGIAEPDRREFAHAFAAGVEAIKARGKSDLGEKTMLDVLIPASRSLLGLAEQDAPLAAMCAELTAGAQRNMLATRDMIATKGRASFLGERALGHIDPGSKTCEVAIAAVCESLKETA
jgi:dihydroxyacetone kinase-like protein